MKTRMCTNRVGQTEEAAAEAGSHRGQPARGAGAGGVEVSGDLSTKPALCSEGS